MPNPPINPVTNLLILLEGLIFRVCKHQSINIGINNINDKYMLIYILKDKNNIVNINEIRIPVHLEHIGIK